MSLIAEPGIRPFFVHALLLSCVLFVFLKTFIMLPTVLSAWTLVKAYLSGKPIMQEAAEQAEGGSYAFPILLLLLVLAAVGGLGYFFYVKPKLQEPQDPTDVGDRSDQSAM